LKRKPAALRAFFIGETMKNRAYSLLSIKSINEDKREITGIASTPETDRMGDIVDPNGAEYKLPIPLLWQHDSGQPIGEVYAARSTKEGIEIKARVAKAPAPGTLSDRLDEAWQSIKIGLVKGLSIGFRPIEYAFMDNGGMHFSKWDWLELSAVTIPANADASIITIKSIDAQSLSALGKKEVEVTKHTGVSVKTTKADASAPVKIKQKEKSMKLSEQIKQFNAELVAKSAAMKELVKEGETLSPENEEKFDTLEAEVEQVKKHLARLNKLQKTEAESAVPPVGDVDTAEKAAAFRANTPALHVKKDQEEKFKGQNYTRMVIAKTLSHLMHVPASVVAEHRWGKTNPTLVQIIKANEVAGLASGSGEAGAELVSADNRYTGDFIEYLNGLTVFDKLPFREVPANVAIKGQDGAATGYWIGESKAIKMSKPDFSTVSLTPLKVAAITTLSNELLRDSSPAAEALVRDALAQASAQRIDTTVFSNDAASGGVSPAGLLNGVSAAHSAGNDGDGLRADVKTLYQTFISAKNAAGLYFVMNPALAKAIQLMTNALGQPEFAGITQNGGTLLGDNVVTGDNINASHLILLKPSEIYKIGDGGIQVSVSNQATIEQSTAPTGAQDTPTAQSQAMVNMFQNESTAIKVVRSINFAKRRSTAVAYVDDADYGSPQT
jgi:HK97 family phage major capsid protein/HK97 family phage prohead protease